MSRIEFAADGWTLEDGTSAPVYVITGTAPDGSEFSIFDPYASECGRCKVDPMQQYGITAEQIAELNAKNMTLLGFIPRGLK